VKWNRAHGPSQHRLLLPACASSPSRHRPGERIFDAARGNDDRIGEDGCGVGSDTEGAGRKVDGGDGLGEDVVLGFDLLPLGPTAFWALLLAP
jgi:hypothetical protein